MTAKHTENLDELYGVLVNQERNEFYNSDGNTFGINLWNAHDLLDTLNDAKALLKKALDDGYENAKVVKLNFTVELVEV